jgi:predicted NUDIX family phosphoesterase
LSSVDIKERVIWGAECRQPAGKGLAFGGQHQDADDGRPHTRLLEGDTWRTVHEELRAKNPLQSFHYRAWKLRNDVKNICARLRHLYLEGLSVAEEAISLRTERSDLEKTGQGILALIDEL